MIQRAVTADALARWERTVTRITPSHKHSCIAFSPSTCTQQSLEEPIGLTPLGLTQRAEDLSYHIFSLIISSVKGLGCLAPRIPGTTAEDLRISDTVLINRLLCFFSPSPPPLLLYSGFCHSYVTTLVPENKEERCHKGVGEA